PCFGTIVTRDRIRAEDDLVNRRRLLVGVASVSLLAVGVLQIPSLHKSAGTVPQFAKPGAESPEPVGAAPAFQPPVIPAPAVAAQYARASAHIGKFEQVEQALFQNREKWEQTGDVDGTVAAVLTPAEINKVRALVKSGSLDAAIEKDIALGHVYKVNQTPTMIFHVKDQTYPYAGPVSYDILRQFLEQLLNQK